MGNNKITQRNMKSAAIVALLGCAAAVSLNSCIESGVDGAGLTCVPGNSQLFATGMNGDEDLGEDIIMKGEPFHYNQKLAAPKKQALFATGMNGDEDLGEDIIMKGEPY